jgi:hypothetical protein
MSLNAACRVIINHSRVMLQIVASFTDDFIGAIYNCNMFIAQPIGENGKKYYDVCPSRILPPLPNNNRQFHIFRAEILKGHGKTQAS